MRTIFAFAALATLAACGSQEPAPEPQPTATVAAPLPEPTPSLPAPDEKIFSEVLAEACPELEPVSTAICKRAGFGSSDVICEYGLGDDEYRRDSATLTPGDGEWTLAEPEAVCAQSAE